MNTEHFDVIIVGAGLSGIGAACHLARECPGKRVGILERRHAIGGTWDLFRYPGIRSDSDMGTYGYRFRPWNEPKILADGPSIRRYVADTAREYGIENKIQFGLKITRLEWSSPQERWIVTALDESTGETRIFRSRFLLSCTGYYNHDEGYCPQFPGADDFKGLCIHPQHWPEGLDYAARTSSSSAAGPPLSHWCPRWPATRRMSPCCSARRATFSRYRAPTSSPGRCAASCRQAGSTV